MLKGSIYRTKVYMQGTKKDGELQDWKATEHIGRRKDRGIYALFFRTHQKSYTR